MALTLLQKQMDSAVQIFHTIFEKEVHAIFKFLCLKEYLLPSKSVKTSYQNSQSKPSIEARTMYWLSQAEPFFISVDNKLANIMSIGEDRKRAETLSEWIGIRHGTHLKIYTRMVRYYSLLYKKHFTIDRILLPSCQKPHWFIQHKHSNGMCVLYFHGGGYIMGNNVGMLPAYMDWFKQLRSNAFSATYNFANQVPLAKIIEQGMEAYQYLVDQCGVHPKRLVIMGESAGANLALNVAKRVGKQGCACVIAVSPWLDLTLSRLEEMKTLLPYDKSLSNRLLDMMKALVCNDVDAANYSPPNWTNEELNELPPLFVTVSKSERMFLDCSGFIERLKRCTEIELQYENDKISLVHAYLHLNEFIKEAKEALEKVTKFIEEHIQRE